MTQTPESASSCAHPRRHHRVSHPGIACQTGAHLSTHQPDHLYCDGMAECLDDSDDLVNDGTNSHPECQLPRLLSGSVRASLLGALSGLFGSEAAF